jgi:methylated-DNA-protein-cysteine methyltransferase-like protein
VVTYGQVAALAGKPHAAREVGWIAAAGGAGIPWQRVVNRSGGLATGYTGGRAGHARALRREGVRVTAQLTVDLRRYQWWPGAAVMARLRLPIDLLVAATTR